MCADKLVLKVPKQEINKIFTCKISQNVSSKLYHIENLNTDGANRVDQNEAVHYEPAYQDLG